MKTQLRTMSISGRSPGWQRVVCQAQNIIGGLLAVLQNPFTFKFTH